MNDKTPTLKEWLKDNPGKGLNDYFQKYPKSNNIDTTLIYNQQSTNYPQGYQSIQRREIDIGTVICSIIILIAFFLPWINTRLPNLYLVDLRYIAATRLYDFITITGFKISILWSYLIYLIPLGAASIFISELLRQDLARLGAEVLVVFVFVGWMILLMLISNYVSSSLGIRIRIISFVGYGIILTFLCVIYFIIDVFRALYGNR